MKITTVDQALNEINELALQDRVEFYMNMCTTDDQRDLVDRVTATSVFIFPKHIKAEFPNVPSFVRFADVGRPVVMWEPESCAPGYGEGSPCLSGIPKSGEGSL